MSRRNVDSGWAWVVLGASFLSFFVALGLVLNVGILYVAFLDEFRESRARTSWIGALQNSVFHLTGPIASALLPWLGARWILMLGALLLAAAYALLFAARSVLYVTLVYGLLAGFGALFALHGAMAAVARYFDRRLYLASGIVSAGAGVGLLAVGIFTEWLLERYGWRGAALLLGGLALQLCIGASLVFDGGGGGEKRDAPTAVDVRPRYLCDARFWFSSLAILLTNTGAVSTYFFLKDAMLSHGLHVAYDRHVACIGLGGTAGRVAAGLIAHACSPLLYYVIAALACAVAVFLMTIAIDEWHFFVLNGAFGCFHGQLQVLQTLIFAHVFDRERMVPAFGYAMGFGCVSALMGPPIGGFIADRTRNYTGTFVFLSSVLLGSALSALVAFIVHRVRGTRPSVDEPSVENAANSSSVTFSSKL